MQKFCNRHTTYIAPQIVVTMAHFSNILYYFTSNLFIKKTVPLQSTFLNSFLFHGSSYEEGVHICLFNIMSGSYIVYM